MTEESVSVPEPAAGNQQEEKRMETYLVAYLDFLGASEKMKKDNGKLLNDIAKLYERTLEFTNNENSAFSDLDVKIFSDNIIVAQKVDKTASFIQFYEKNLYGVLSFTALLQLLSAETPGLLLRGGITMGDFYFDEQFVWGPALLRAHDLEDKVSVYPRVVIDTPVLDYTARLSEMHRLNLDKMHPLEIELTNVKVTISPEEAYNIYIEEINSLILRDFDGMRFLNYIQIILLLKSRYDFAVSKVGENNVDKVNPNLSSSVNLIPNMLQSARNAFISFAKDNITARVYPKISWTLTYFNTVCLHGGYPDYVIRESEYPKLPAYCRNNGGGNA